MQQVYRRTPILKCDFNKVAKHLDGCFCIRNLENRIHSANVYTSVLFTLTKIISKAKNLILFPYCLCRCFFFLRLSTLMFYKMFFNCHYFIFPACQKMMYASNLSILLGFFSTATFYLPDLTKTNVCLRCLSN